MSETIENQYHSLTVSSTLDDQGWVHHVDNRSFEVLAEAIAYCLRRKNKEPEPEPETIDSDEGTEE